MSCIVGINSKSGASLSKWTLKKTALKRTLVTRRQPDFQLLRINHCCATVPYQSSDAWTPPSPPPTSLLVNSLLPVTLAQISVDHLSRYLHLWLSQCLTPRQHMTCSLSYLLPLSCILCATYPVLHKRGGGVGENSILAWPPSSWETVSLTRQPAWFCLGVAKTLVSWKTRCF